MKTQKLIALAAAALLAIGAQAGSLDDIGSRSDRVALTGNQTAPTNWRLTDGMTFNGTSFDGVARLLFDNDGDLNNGSGVCSGTLLKGGAYVLTAAHCADDFNVMRIDFGIYGNVAKETRGVSQAFVHSGWDGGAYLGMGSDIAILKLDRPVTTIQGFNMSGTNDLGKDFLIMGYGTTTTGGSATPTNWNDWGWGHFGYNTADVDGKTFNTAIFGNDARDDKFGMEYIADYDSMTNRANHNTLARLAAISGNQWSSSQGLGLNEALISGGDSGGGDFVWNGTEWLLSGVHSWGWQICPNSWGCDFSKANSSSWGDISGSTAVFSHTAWLNSTMGVPEPGALAIAALMAAGFAGRRRKSKSA